MSVVHAAIIFELVRDAALLALGVLGYCQIRAWMRDRLPGWAGALLCGTLFGALGFVSMLTPIEPVSGLRLDLRNAAVVTATLFGGIGTGAVGLAWVAAVRLYFGGPGLLGGLLSPSIAFIIAVGAVVHLRRRGTSVDRRALSLVSLAVGAAGLGLIVLFPRPSATEDVLLDVAPIWVVMMPLTIFFLGRIILHFEGNRALTRALVESEQRFRGFYNETPVMLTATDPEGRIVAASDHWLEVLGYERHEVVGRNRREFLSPAAAARVRTELVPELERAGRARGELQLIRKDGTLIDVSVNTVVSRDPATGGPLALTFSVDQTEQKKAEQALRETETRLQAIIDNSPFAIFLKDREGRYRLINRTYAEWFNERPEDIIGHTASELYTPEVARPIDENDREVLEKGQVSLWERRSTLAKPGIEHILVTKFPVRDQGGAVVGFAGFISDITDRKRTELALEESRELLIEAERLGKVGYFHFDAASGRVYWSDSLFELRRTPRRDSFSLEETVGFLHPEDRPRYMRARTAAIAARRDFAFEARVLRGDGSVGWEHGVGHPRFDAKGNLVGVLFVTHDVTEGHEAQETLRQSEERYRALIEHSDDIIVVVTPDGHLTYRSPTMNAGLGYDEEDRAGMGRGGKRVFDLVHPDDVGTLVDTFRALGATQGSRATGRSRVRHKDGTYRVVAWSARNASDVPRINGIIVNLRDITESQKLEEQLLQSQKMEAVGRLAGGIAHDFNNILGAILGFAGFLLQDLPAGSPEHGFAERITTAGARGRDLVQQILTFARSSGVQRKPTDLARMVVETRDLLRASLPASTRVEIEAEGDALVANVNAGQITQILLNLCLNANDALASEPGTIRIEIARVSPGADDFRLFHGAAPVEPPGGRIADGNLKDDRAYARITVTDTGVGMEASVLGRVFDPFFTTKQRGQGTGLGLSVVHGIVMAYGGACVVTSRPLAGSAFVIYLPLAEAGELAMPSAPPDENLRGHERILVVDDEQIMTDMLTIGLDRLGYEVVALNDPREAVETLREDPGAWDIVISDQVMPGMKGLTMLREMREIRGDLRFFLCTGFSDGATEAAALAAGADAFFLKPVSPERLAAAIRQMIDQSSGARALVRKHAT